MSVRTTVSVVAAVDSTIGKLMKSYWFGANVSVHEPTNVTECQ